MFIQQKFILHFVFNAEVTERGNVQDVQLSIPSGVDNFGDKYGKDHIYDMRAYNKDLLKMPDLKTIRLGSQVMASIFIATKLVTLKDGKTFYQPYITLKGLEVIKLKETEEKK